MPCMDIDGNTIACLIGGAPNPDIAFGYGVDYEQAAAAAKAAGKAPARTSQLGGASPTPVFGVQFIDDGQGGGYYADANGRRLNPDELAGLKAASSGGLTFDEQMRLKQTPSVSVSTSPPDALDWAKEARAAEQDRITRERNDRLDAAALKKYTDDVAREDVKLRILTEQNKIANDRDNRTEQREIARDIENAQYRRDQASARVDELNMAALNRAAEYNASATETAAQRQEQHRATTIAGQRQNAVDIAGFQQMPGDVGMLGAYLQARQGEGGSDISTAIGQGENFITDRSLEPLGGLLDVRSELSRPVTFGAARYDPAIMGQPQQGIFNRSAPNGMPAPATQEEMQTRADAAAWANTPQEGQASGMGAIQYDPATQQWTQGGQVVDAFAAAAAMQNPAPGAAPQAAPAQQQAAQQSQPTFTREASYQPMTTTYGAPTQANPGARIFQRQAAQEARTRSGLTGDLTPIAYSDPGTNPYLAELAASVTAAERGVDTKLFERERARLAPKRMPVFGRSR